MKSFDATTTASMEEAEAAIRCALEEQGFGVLTEIDVAAKLKAALDYDRAPLRILGACSPWFARRALDIDPSVALLMPCNVVLEGTDHGTRVSIVDPRALIDDPDFADLADEAAERLRAAVATIDH